MIRLVIADDHAIVRSGLKQLFALNADIEISGEAENSEQLLDCLRHCAVDLVLLDLNMPGPGGCEAIGRIRREFPALPILVLSMHNELQIVGLALKAGANGYLTKDSDPETLMAAIRRVAAGQRFIDPKLAEKIVFADEAETEKKPHQKLSAREFQIMQLLASGKGINEISQELGISNKTVSTYKSRLCDKLQIKNTAELIRYYDAQVWQP
ncbi:response regulator transcription factor [Methylomonas sp. SURF-1]|uniref:Response regulator transcription factor n=1 Tax=Methylomonas aurea TaxID=2952224 RepID=A0ABT1UKM4_9GAMM|nr:response regulator transcription factor [Methylomonas sp. SURF-1]MCQ8182770.1 response regulator transcription factor [Methylomonas sp. SURF-1]